MKIRTENKDRVLMENHFIEDDNMGVYGWYGLTYFEVEVDDTNISLSEEEFEKLFELMQEMKKEVDRLNRL